MKVGLSDLGEHQVGLGAGLQDPDLEDRDAAVLRDALDVANLGAGRQGIACLIGCKSREVVVADTRIGVSDDEWRVEKTLHVAHVLPPSLGITG